MICSLINKVQVVRWQERSTPVPYTCIKQCTSSELPLAVGHYIKAHKLGLLGPWWIVWSPRRLFFARLVFTAVTEIDQLQGLQGPFLVSLVTEIGSFSEIASQQEWSENL